MTLYNDAEHSNEIGSFNIRFFKEEYIVGTPAGVLGMGRSLNMTLGAPVEEDAETEYVNITKEEYETITTKINQLHSIIKNFNKK